MIKRIIAVLFTIALALPFYACKNEEGTKKYEETNDVWVCLKDAKKDTLEVVQQFQDGSISASEANTRIQKIRKEVHAVALSVNEDEWPQVGSYVYMYIDGISGSFNQMVEKEIEEGSDAYDSAVEYIEGLAEDLEKLEIN